MNPYYNLWLDNKKKKICIWLKNYNIFETEQNLKLVGNYDKFRTIINLYLIENYNVFETGQKFKIDCEIR